MTASTRRAALGALLAAPLATTKATAVAVPAVDAALIALGPQLVAMLDEYDRHWAKVHEPYEAWDRARERMGSVEWARYEALPEWKVYIAARDPADAIGERIEALYEPFFDEPLTTLPAIMLRHRYGMTFESCREDALADLDRLWRASA